jgi:hypothetical protein
MSQHEDVVRLRHMLDHALEAAEMVQGKTRSDLDKDRQLNLYYIQAHPKFGPLASYVHGLLGDS